MTTPELRDKDRHILQQIQEGNDDVQKITSATTHENHHVTYAFQKLEDLDLIKVTKPEGTVERTIDGQKRVFQHPKQAELTKQGKQTLEDIEEEGIDYYDDLSHSDLVEKIHRLEERIAGLEKKFEMLRDQIQNELNY